MKVFIFKIIFHVLAISFRISLSSMAFVPLILFTAVYNISISVNRYNFTLIFFKADCHANPGAEKNEQGQA